MEGNNDGQANQPDSTPESKTIPLEQYQALQRKLDTSRKVATEALRAQAQTATEMGGRQERIETMLDLLLTQVGRGDPDVETTISAARKDLTTHKETTASFAKVTSEVKAAALEHGVDVESDPRFGEYREALSARNFAEAASVGRRIIAGLDEEPMDAKVAKRVREVLAEMGRTVDQGSSTASSKPKREWTKAEIAALSPTDWKKNKEEILSATAEGRIRG